MNVQSIRELKFDLNKTYYGRRLTDGGAINMKEIEEALPSLIPALIDGREPLETQREIFAKSVSAFNTAVDYNKEIAAGKYTSISLKISEDVNKYSTATSVVRVLDGIYAGHELTEDTEIIWTGLYTTKNYRLNVHNTVEKQQVHDAVIWYQPISNMCNMIDVVSLARESSVSIDLGDDDIDIIVTNPYSSPKYMSPQLLTADIIKAAIDTHSTNFDILDMNLMDKIAMTSDALSHGVLDLDPPTTSEVLSFIKGGTKRVVSEDFGDTATDEWDMSITAAMAMDAIQHVDSLQRSRCAERGVFRVIRDELTYDRPYYDAHPVSGNLYALLAAKYPNRQFSVEVTYVRNGLSYIDVSIDGDEKKRHAYPTMANSYLAACAISGVNNANLQAMPQLVHLVMDYVIANFA